ncbi:hypothetical protein [Actinoplanes sp. NPDC051494]|uniref:hypothetical protein n=1 Tax=Actinoplanes sp. NPDC051494 TaxID=3363907 RepID=UPI003791F155
MHRISALTTSLLMAAAVIPATATTATAAPAAMPVTSGYAYVWANQPTTGSYVPAAAYSANSTGGVNTVSRLGTGRYIVRMPNLGTFGGVAHATAYGSTDATCQVNQWYVAGTRIDLYVQCNRGTGALLDNRFTASFTNEPASTTTGYLWADQPSAASYTPSPTYQWNSAGGTNTVQRQGPGSYVVRLPGLGTTGGHVQVTAYGRSAARCKVVSWGPSGSTQLIRVNCRNAAGVLTDNRYTLTYVDHSGLLSSDSSAYVWANSPTSAQYYPAANYRFNSSGLTNSVRRISTGNYLVALPHQPLGNGTVHVTAYGPKAQRCTVGSWGSAGVRVLCRTSAGAWTDTQFDLAFQR